MICLTPKIDCSEGCLTFAIYRYFLHWENSSFQSLEHVSKLYAWPTTWAQKKKDEVIIVKCSSHDIFIVELVVALKNNRQLWNLSKASCQKMFKFLLRLSSGLLPLLLAETQSSEKILSTDASHRSMNSSKKQLFSTSKVENTDWVNCKHCFQMEYN